MSQCELCNEKGYDLWKCSICNKTPLCAKHVILQRDCLGMWVMYCYACVKPKTKKLKSSEKRRMKEDELMIAREARKRIMAESNARKKFDEWMLDNPNWESEERESYMRKAEEKCMLHINRLKSEKLNAYYIHYRNSGAE